jgi:DNA-binding NarL/FixJ family response regulator
MTFFRDLVRIWLAKYEVGDSDVVCRRPIWSAPPRKWRGQAGDWTICRASSVNLYGARGIGATMVFTLIHSGICPIDMLRLALSIASEAPMSGVFEYGVAVTKLRVLLADDHDVVRSGLRPIVEAQENWEVVAEARNGKEAVAKAIETKPDVAVVDYSLPLLNGVEVTRQIRARLPRTEVLIFTMHDNEILIQDLLRAGARGYLLKSDATKYIIEAIEALALHRPFFTTKVAEAMLQVYAAKQSQATSPLTNRERTIVQLIAEGHSNKSIASTLNISLKTVETHRASVMRKLNLSSSAALVRYAVRNKIVEP